ncbi:alpha/beta fold hydrolase [Kutzneria buriramensis]|uniref:Pimeloyl-ACP methyl ester carboxylesterase n=1 Tax=Kutzneria buriramensis TaxID=1045776 RepID=A0A3E0HYK4_9PSEU|nr:alpha/beta hydrolase [Kutzneria buriramensis]REH51558.1 pimeloyl-ACP methyl ester carboxylesterase [Kutzneria buriramensis]
MPLLTASTTPDGFVEKTIQVNGITVNYAIGGGGPAVVLLHGYPETWYSWRKVMPALAERYTVIAPDLRGSGGSDAPESGYDKATLAEDVHQLLVALGLDEQVNVVGHDIGTMVAYAYAAAHRSSTRRLALLEAPLVDELAYELPAWTRNGPGLWNFGFFTLDNGLPEKIVVGREDIWIEGFIGWMELVKGGVDEQALAEYAQSLRRPGYLRASYEYFTTFPRDVQDTIRNRGTALTMPVLAIGAEGALGEIVPDQARKYAHDVTGAVIPGGHWIPEEAPEILLEHMLPFLAY